MLVLDGSQGEGGGQILRSALALSLVTGTPFRIENIRAGRPRPGLMRQHLTAVQAAATVSGGEVTGATVGAASLTFRPGTVRCGDYAFSVGTAGSATLVLQTVLPALITGPAPSTVVLEGGTHNPAAPPFDFLTQTYFPVLRQMGPRVEAVLERPGFYPAGGGRMRVSIDPVARLAPVAIEERGRIKACRGRVLVANLPTSIARREIDVLIERLGWPEQSFSWKEENGAAGPGNVVMAEVESEALIEVFTAFGEKGVPAEAVAVSLARQVLAYLAASAPVGVHLADQLVLLLALAGGGSFQTMPPSNHTRTQLATVARFLTTPVSAVPSDDHRNWRFEFGATRNQPVGWAQVQADEDQ